MRCPSCGGELPAWSRFCSWCGAPAPPAAWAGAPGTQGDVPDWRATRGGRVLLHVAVGLLGLWSLQLLLIALALPAAGRERAPMLIDLLPAATGLAGWLLFVSLRTGPGARWAALVGSLTLGLSVNLAVNLSLQARA